VLSGAAETLIAFSEANPDRLAGRRMDVVFASDNR